MIRRRFIAVVLCLASFAGCGQEKPKHRHEPTQVLVLDPFAPLGTVLSSKNTDDTLNTSLGDQNHLAIYVGNGQIVESQEDQGGVILTSLHTYLGRAYTWYPLYPRDLEVGKRAAARAKTLIGWQFRQISSLLRVDRKEWKGLNCVSVVRVSYSYALGRDLPELRIPDHATQMTDVFTTQKPTVW